MKTVPIVSEEISQNDHIKVTWICLWKKVLSPDYNFSK